MALLNTFVRIIVVCWYTYTMWYDITFIGLKFEPKFAKESIFMAGRLIFLTYWNMIILVAYNLIAVINDIFGTNEVTPKQVPFIRKFKDYLFACISFPLCLFVAVTFWGIYAIDRELVYPKRVDEFIPSWINHTMHTFIVPIVFFELFTTFRRYPSTKAALKGMIPAILAYLGLIHLVQLVKGHWVYPVLGALNLQQRFLMIVGVTLYGISFYFVGKFINNTIWSTEMNKIKDSKKKSK